MWLLVFSGAEPSLSEDEGSGVSRQGELRLFYDSHGEKEKMVADEMSGEKCDGYS